MRGFRKPNTNHSQSSLRKKTKIGNVLHAGKGRISAKHKKTEIFSGTILDSLNKKSFIFFELTAKFMSDMIWCDLGTKKRESRMAR